MAKKKVHAARRPAARSAKKKPASAGRSRPKAKSAPSSPAAVKQTAAALLKWVHGTTDALIAGIPADRATYQPSPRDNHLLWTIGHLATAYSWFASLIDGKMAALPESYDKLFGYKSAPVADAGVYPLLAEVKKHYDAAYGRLYEAVAALKPADLYKPPAAESHGFASSRLDVIHKTIWHDGWHSGQLSSIRRALGLPPMM
ncbi:MAG: DinB family protein [Phycisphaerales bacterium]|nr:DinB family protein [Phycisphaerales bacterium]